MSEPVETETRTDTAYVNGAVGLHTRVADLLDDVTVAAPVRRPATDAAPSERAPAATAQTPAANAALVELAPADVQPTHNSRFAEPPPPTISTVTPTQTEGEAQSERSALPGEPLVGASRRSNGLPADLPPFLQQQPTAPGAEAAPAATADVAAAPAMEKPNQPRMETTALLPPSTSLAEPTRADSDDQGQPAPTNQILNIRGRSDGVAIEVGRGTWNEVLAVLTERLGQSASFFRNSSVALDIGARPVVEDELLQFANVLAAYEMKLGVVRTSSERAFQAALAVGMTVTLESTEGATVAAAATASSNAAGRGTEDASYFVYRGYLRSGHRLRRKESILVIGDINPGAEVISDGDVLVWGRLRGIVHAGAAGNRRSLVAALDLEPTQMRIADVTTIGPDPRPGQPGRFFWRRSQHKRPEIARLVQQDIVIEEWDASRPGGFVSLRRGAG